MNVFLVYKGSVFIGVYDALAKANTIAAYVKDPNLNDTRVERIKANYAHAEIAAGEELYAVRFEPVTSTTPITRKLSLATHLEQNEFEYNHHTRRFRVAVFATTQAAAELEAEAIRAAFVTNNNL